jgi:hypothetical protein
VFDDSGWEDGEPDPLPSPLEDGEYDDDLAFDDPAFDDVAFEELIAADPERERTVAEVVAAAEGDPVVSELAAVDLATATDDERVAVMVAAQRRINHFEAVKLAAMAAFAGPEPRDDVAANRSAAAFAWAEISAALHLGEGTARALTHTAQRLVSHLPATLAAMLAGELSYSKARTLNDATATLNRDQCAAVEERVLTKAGGRNPAQHTQAVGRTVRSVDPDGWARRREQQLADIAMIRYLHGDGVADVLLKSVDACDEETLWTGADTWARAAKAAGDPRTLDALRVAALVDWASTYLTGTPITPMAGDADSDTGADKAPASRPTRNGQPATVNIVIGLPDLLNPATGGAATIAGSGEPIPADAVAELLRHGAKIRFALVDTSGRLAGVSTKLHDPIALQRVFVALRDVTVRVPGGSTAPVAGQDVDHLDPDGPTEPDNMHVPTRGWHRAKTFGHWTVTANPDGSITWTSRRTSRTYTTHPYNHRDDP